MAVRATMDALILRVRGLIGDTATTPANCAFSDPDIQAALDRERLDINLSDWRELVPHYSAQPGPFNWAEYYDPSGWGDWEGDATLYNQAMQQLLPTLSDTLTGHWSFAPGQQVPPVFVVGKTYDVYAAAYTLVLRQMAQSARAYDFSADGASFHRSQMVTGLQALADQLATEMRPRTARLVRSDTRGAWGGW